MKRILSIDGGGIKGVFPASFLAPIEDSIGGKVSDHFDLIVGTSTGGIIALGLGLGFSAKEILDFYVEMAPDVFKGNPWLRAIRKIGISKYDSKPLKEALQKQFGDKRLGDSKKRLVIPSLNLETGEVYVYKTAHHKRFERDHKEKITQIALATSAAPTYFPTHRSEAGLPMIDGGLWANNPVGFAVVEAIGVLGWPREELKILSLGCTTAPIDIGIGRKFSLGMGCGYWGLKISDVFLTAQCSASLGIAQLLADFGENKNVIRISPVVAKNRFELDSIKEISSLQGLGSSEARKALPSLRRQFFEGDKAEEFEPIWKL